ncbi:MAG: histidine phosphatase family protein [Bacteroidia bacterium]|nr:histidine phosphatase family protein [Bacteroidia bacterium]
MKTKVKRIVLVRHAKALDLIDGITDFERSLKLKGIRDAHKVAQKLLNYNFKPDMMISSPAFRSIETAIIFARELRYPVKKIKIKESLYEEYSTADFMEMIHKTENDMDTVFVFGHNPELSTVASYLAEDFCDDIATSGVAVIESDVEKWKKVNLNEGRVALYVYPDQE